MRVYDGFAQVLSKQVRQGLERTLARITSFEIDDFVNGELFGPSAHLLNGNGKLLRPALLFLGAEAIGEDCSDFVELAVGIELLHVSSLVHDDIIDKGKTRRGVKAVNEKYGNSPALLAGNALISKAIECSADYGKDVMREVSWVAMRMCAGEMLDYKSQKSKSISMERYLEIANLKTAALTGTACSVAAVYKQSGARQMLYNFGCNLGIAFQIRDDILDFTEPEKDYSEKAESGANIVTSIMQKHGCDISDSIQKASELNRHYVVAALNEIRGKAMAESLEPYARMIEIGADYDGLRAVTRKATLEGRSSSFMSTNP